MWEKYVLLSDPFKDFISYMYEWMGVCLYYINSFLLIRWHEEIASNPVVMHVFAVQLLPLGDDLWLNLASKWQCGTHFGAFRTTVNHQGIAKAFYLI